MPDNALKRLADMRKPGRWLIAAIEGVEESNGMGRFDPGWFHPSDFGHECDAFLAFRFLGAPAIEAISARTRRIFDLGSARDVDLKRDIGLAGVSLIKEPEDRSIVIPAVYIRGELDEWVENPITKERFVVDIKTMRPDLWEKIEETLPSHKLQLHPYMFAKETYKGLILVENKGNQDLKCLTTDWENKTWQEKIVDRVYRILTELGFNRVQRNPVHCSSCPFFANGICTANQIQKLKEESGLNFA